jgi:hypothetical protein
LLGTNNKTYRVNHLIAIKEYIANYTISMAIKRRFGERKGLQSTKVLKVKVTRKKTRIKLKLKQKLQIEI